MKQEVLSSGVMRGSLSRRLFIWFLLVAVTPVVLIGWLSYTVANDSLHKNAGEAVISLVNTKSEFVNNWFSYRTIDIETQAKSEGTIRLITELHNQYLASSQSLQGFVESDDWERIVEEHSVDLIRTLDAYQYYDVLLIDLEGNVLFTNAKEVDLGTNLIDGPYAGTKLASAFVQSAEESRTIFSDLEQYEPSNGSITGFLTTGIKDAQGKIMGVIAFQLSTDQLEFALGSSDEMANSAKVYIIGLSDSESGVSLRTSLRHISENGSTAFFQVGTEIQNSQTQLWFTEHGPNGTRTVGMKESPEVYQSSQGLEVLGFHHDLVVHGVHWGVIAEMPTSEAFKASNTLGRIIFWFIIVISVLVFIVARRVTRRIVQPIVALSDAVKRAAQGDLDQVIETDGNCEIGELAESFSAMLGHLQNTFTDLTNQKYVLDQHAIVSIADIEGDIIYVNDKFVELSGYSSEELLGQNHRMVKSDEHDPEFYRNIWKTIASKKVWVGELKNIAKDGSHYWVRATIVPIRDSAGKISQYMAIRTDITELKDAESMLQEANDSLLEQRNELVEMTQELELSRESAESASASKSEFLANMSHEIRTPMTAILGFAETLQECEDEEGSGIDRSQAIHTIIRNGEHLLTIINDILDMSKIEAGKMEVEQIRCSPIELVRDVQSLMAIRADEKNLPLEVLFDGEIPETIISDPTRLRQILVNIVGNAIKFTEQGSVQIVTRLLTTSKFIEQDQIQFDVVDTGIGLNESQIEKLFSAFTQADSSTTRNFGGTGLGLEISKRFANMLGGSITIESTPGMGSTFSITIAIGSTDDVSMVKGPSHFVQDLEVEKKTPSNSKGLLDFNILLAEDGVDNQRLITFVLKKAGAQVTIADNGQVAVDLALQASLAGKPFDVILMDMQMPVMSGYDAAATLREEGYLLPIIALTAHAMGGDREKCISAGCNDFATKPIDRAKLIGIIQQYIQRNSSAA